MENINKIEEYINRECGDMGITYKYGFLLEYAKQLYMLVEKKHPELLSEYHWLKID